jgi:hypothetical protein
MKTLLFVFGIVCLISCSTTQVIPLRGIYPSEPFVKTINAPYDSVWNNVIDYYAQKGIGISVIEKVSGLIVAKDAELKWTLEDKNGKLAHPQNWAVIPKIIETGYKGHYTVDIVTGQWNVHIKKITETSTSVNINLTNIDGTINMGADKYGFSHYRHLTGKSTGNFEAMIFNYLLKNNN